MQMGPWQFLVFALIIWGIVALVRRGGKRRRLEAENQARIATALEDIARQKKQD